MWFTCSIFFVSGIVTHSLQVNYRSTPVITATANAVLGREATISHKDTEKVIGDIEDCGWNECQLVMQYSSYTIVVPYVY